ncbi:YesL family protein [uncultured Eubacterium sp.]|uniref:YesL family protein n=1 Tax=uncultured Eubacterium sp. TaxID=165185 RepID=UPI002636C329|nr:YesL family protein [uncultured Eubacterium sp.]
MFGIDSKFYEVVSKIADLVVLNLLFVLFSLPIITMGASTTALYGVTKKMAENREGYIFRNFFQLFKENFRQSTVMWIILLVAAMIPTVDLYIINSLEKTVITTALKGLMLATALTVLLVFLYAMALQSTFENTIKNTLKNAFLMGIGYFPWTLLILLITLLPIILIVLLGKTAGSVVYVMLFVGFAILAYLNSYIFNHIFKKYM